MKKKLLTILVLLCSVYSTQAQKYYTGAMRDDSTYAQLPLLPDDGSKGLWKSLPSKASLRQYCPTPGSQGDYGTCVGWATAYAARTIVEAVAKGWKDTKEIDKEVFSPSFIYTRIKKEKDDTCQNGASIPKAFQVLKDEGVVKHKDFPKDCPSSIPDEIVQKAQKYRVRTTYKLFDVVSKSSPSKRRKIYKTKEQISEKRPVVILMSCYESFYDAKGTWTGEADVSINYHAMCVVGYDDQKEGGAFLLMNSWGTEWGSEGFTWITYDDYAKYVEYAIVMIK